MLHNICCTIGVILTIKLMFDIEIEYCFDVEHSLCLTWFDSLMWIVPGNWNLSNFIDLLSQKGSHYHCTLLDISCRIQNKRASYLAYERGITDYLQQWHNLQLLWNIFVLNKTWSYDKTASQTTSSHTT